jgi:hypothetical protein
MDTGDFVSVELILADAASFCGDEEFKRKSLSWYKSQVQSALERLAIETFWNRRTIDMPLDKIKLQLNMPSDFFNLRELYVWSGKCCEPATRKIVHYKRRYNNKAGQGGTQGTSRRSNVHGEHDPYFNPSGAGNQAGGIANSNLFYANIENNVIMFSATCAAYDMVRIVGNGFGGNVDKLPVIPRFLREATIDFVVERYFRAAKVHDHSQRVHWIDADKKLNQEYDGSWAIAERTVKQMNTWQLDGILEYMSEINA